MTWFGSPYLLESLVSIVRRCLGTAQKMPSPIKSLTEKGCGDADEGEIEDSTTSIPRLPKIVEKLVKYDGIRGFFGLTWWKRMSAEECW